MTSKMTKATLKNKKCDADNFRDKFKAYAESHVMCTTPDGLLRAYRMGLLRDDEKKVFTAVHTMAQNVFSPPFRKVTIYFSNLFPKACVTG